MPPYHWGEFQIHAFQVPPFMGPHCLSCEFTELAKLALEKQTCYTAKPGNGTACVVYECSH